MIEQTVLPFKLAATEDWITAHAGLSLLGEFARGIGLERELDRRLPAPGSAPGYRPSQFVLPLVLMLNGGGRSLEDLRELREDEGLRKLLEWEEIPASDTTGDWLRRMGGGRGLKGLEQVNRTLVHRQLRAEARREYTLDPDATVIAAEKEAAQWSYKGVKGYTPLVGHLAENGLVVGDEFREGNASPGAGNLEFLQHCQRQMPKGKRIGYFRSDSAAYQAKVINYCMEERIRFAIGADLDAAVRGAIAAIPEAAWRPYQDGWIAETVHTMNQTDHAFRLVVIRRPAQGELFAEGKERLTAIASDREEGAEETVAWYNQRGETSENRLKELKLGVGMERMPCGQFEANAMFFRIGVLAYNLSRLFELQALPEGWARYQLRTLRWKLFLVAGKVVRHGGQAWLKVRGYLEELFRGIRRRSWAFSRS